MILIFKYLYYRMYKAYYDKNESPAFRAFMYLSLVLSFLGGVILIYIERILELIGQANYTYYINNPIFWIVFYGGFLLYTYLCYTRRSFQYYENLFLERTWLNKNIKIWMLIVLPFVIFFVGIYLSVILFGGEILGNEVIGFFY